MIDHFSKHSFSYLLSDKKVKIILECIKDCFKKNGIPEEFGRIMLLSIVNKSKNIKFIQGKAFHPL